MTAQKKVAVDFEEIIRADRESRQRQKNEALAQQIFGKARRSSGPGAGPGSRKAGTGASLASRVGIAKRAFQHTGPPSVQAKANQSGPFAKAAGNVDAEWTHDLHDSNASIAPRITQTSNRNSRANRASRAGRLHNALNGSASSPALNSQVNIVTKSVSSKGMSIRGIAGPSVVIAENFAPGTTAADIESAMTPIGGPMNCSVRNVGSVVIAELRIESRDGADNVIEHFHNQTADGRLLRVYYSTSPAAPASKTTEPLVATPPLGPRADIGTARSGNNRSSTRFAPSDRYEPRTRSRERRRSYDRDGVVDGSYGFDERMDVEEPENSNTPASQGLYSDNMVGGRGDRNDNVRRWADNRGRGRGGERNRNTGRGQR